MKASRRCPRARGWTLCRSGVWDRPEGIATLEAHAALASVHRLAQTRRGHDVGHVHLSDNMGVALSIYRSRSKDYAVQVIIRRIKAYLLARNIRLAVRWIPSGLNSADGASRIFDDSASCSLAWRIPPHLLRQSVEVPQGPQ
eukprot:2803617-Pyramimonas_sp.AAC.1